MLILQSLVCTSPVHLTTYPPLPPGGRLFHINVRPINTYKASLTNMGGYNTLNLHICFLRLSFVLFEKECIISSVYFDLKKRTRDQTRKRGAARVFGLVVARVPGSGRTVGGTFLRSQPITEPNARHNSPLIGHRGSAYVRPLGLQTVPCFGRSRVQSVQSLTPQSHCGRSGGQEFGLRCSWTTSSLGQRSSTFSLQLNIAYYV